MPKLSGNKGEWSEIYTLFRLLEIGKLYAADADLNKKHGVFYNVLNVIRTENVGELSFEIDNVKNEISIIKTGSKEVLLTVAKSEFKTAADKLYQEITNAEESAFMLEDTELFLNRIFINTLKAKSTDKADIRMKIHDINTGYDAIQGFSIKSRLGSPSTLVNAGKTTNFIYEIVGPVTDDIMVEFNTKYKKFYDKFQFLYTNCCDIKYVKVEHDTFNSNLRLLDGDLPEICGEMLKAYYGLGIPLVRSALIKINRENPLNYPLEKGHPFYDYKFKKLLTESALGMLPSKVWDGKADATGGYIIVREDGEVLCYHLFNRNEFEDYLVNNTKFETASTSRHQFGNIYKENSRYYLKLNLQIRFIK